MSIGVVLVTMGLVVSGASLMRIASSEPQVAQMTQPQSSSPSVPAGKDNGPAEAKPGGTRPTTPAPEPAQPDPGAQKAGAQPALPPAPAEKTAEPIKPRG